MIETLIDTLRHCNAGGTAMLIKKGQHQTYFRIGKGLLFVRGWIGSSLISVKPDIVIFLDEDVPLKIHSLILSHQPQAKIKTLTS